MNTPQKIQAIISHFTALGPLPADNVILAFAKRVCEDPDTLEDTPIADAIQRVNRTLDLMRRFSPGSLVTNDADYETARAALNHLDTPAKVQAVIAGLRDSGLGDNGTLKLAFAQRVSEELNAAPGTLIQTAIDNVNKTINNMNFLKPNSLITTNADYKAARATINYLSDFEKLFALTEHFTDHPELHPNPLPSDYKLTFARRVCEDGYTAAGTRIEDAIQRVNQTLNVMKSLNPGSAITNNVDYESAEKGRKFVYDYMDNLGRNRTNDAQFRAAITALKAVFGKGANDPLNGGEGQSLEAAYNIEKFERDVREENQQLNMDFTNKQAILKIKITPEGGRPADYRIDNVNLLNDWNRGIAEIDRIALTKAVDPIRLNYKKLTYEDIYSKFFDIEYANPPNLDQQINNIRGKLIQLAETRLTNAPDPQYDDLRGQFSNPPPANTQKEVFKNLANKRLNDILPSIGFGRDDGHFRIRLKAIFDHAPQTEVPPHIARPGDAAYNVATWNQHLEDAQFTIGTKLIAALEGCDTGKDTKLGVLENAYAGVLGTIAPKVKARKAVAAMIKQLKMQRIEESGKNPDTLRKYEENVTAPNLLMQRLRGPFGLLKDYQTVIGVWAGLPLEPKNDPVQIIKNMFLPNQPARPYQISGPVRVNGRDINPHQLANPVNNPYVRNLDGSAEVRIPVAPHLTVKSLVEKVYDEFGKSITREMLVEYERGSKHLYSKDQMIPLQLMTDGVFIKYNPEGGLDAPAKDFYTREMAFFILENMGYVQVTPAIKEQVYEFNDATGEPRKTLVGGAQRSLKELIDLY